MSAALVLALFGGTVHAVAAPQPVPVLQQAVNDPPPQEVDEEYEFYKMLVGDIAEHAADVEVRDAAAAALAVNTKERLIWFLDHGQAEAQARADERKRVEKVENRRKVEEWARTGGPNVRAGAQAALNSGDQAIADFVAYGHEIAVKQDKKQAEDDKAEQDRIIARVRDMVAMGGPQVKIEGEAVLASQDYARIRQFYLTDYHEANKRDHDFQQAVLKALEDRNKALAELDQLARRSTAAANARAEIMRANIDAVKHLEDVTYAMKRAIEAAHKADQIFRDDKPGRAHGQLGRNDLLDAERARAAEESAQAARIAEASVEATQRARGAAARLVDTGMTNGLDWAKVTIGIGSAVDAAALAAETSAHAAAATLADSRALDADRNAQEHAENAARYRAEAERQATKAAELAEAAKKQQEIAVAARNRAEEQKTIANAKAAQAQTHATNARNRRINAQNAARNAAASASAAFTANAEASRLAGDHDTAVAKVRSVQTQINFVTKLHSARMIGAEQLELELSVAEQKARERGENVEQVTAEIRARATAARGSANESAGWASAAQASAAAARAEAQRAETAARQAREAANRATQEAVTARRAADEAHRLTLEATNAALGAKASAEMTQHEAEASVREANEAVFQSVVADRAASAAAASASLVVDSARAAEVILKPYASINADARKALKAVSDALITSAEQSRAAQEKATEAGQAATRARKAADEAKLDVKPAYEAAARAAESANQAAQYAKAANDAANQAVKHTAAAHSAAGTATKWSNNASQDAVMAGNAASAASASAASADRAATATENIYAMARATADKVQLFLQEVTDRLDSVHEYRLRLEMAEQIAREEAEKKRTELNKDLAWKILAADQCLRNPLGEVCRRAAEKVEGFVKSGVEAYSRAALESMKTAARCGAGDQAACQMLRDHQDEFNKLYDTIALGLVEGAKGTLDGVLTGLECIGGLLFLDTYQCQQIWNGLIYTIENPYTLIHLEEWHDNPAKALGMTWWDLAFGLTTTVFSGGTSAFTKTLGAMKAVLGKGSGKVLDNLADLRGFLVKLDDGVPNRLPGSIGEILNVKVRIDNGIGRIDNAVAVIDGQLYRLESYSRRLEGDLSKLDGATVRVEGGTLRIENGLAKLDDAKLKIEAPKPCAAGMMSVAAAGCGPNGERTYDRPEIVDGEYRHDIGALKVRIKAADYAWGKDSLRQAAISEKIITPDVDEIADIVGAKREYRDAPTDKRTELKSESSYMRKQFEETDGGKKSPESIKSKMNDTVRYTFTFEPDNYAPGLKRAIAEFAKKGYTRIELKNFWLRNQKDLPEGAEPKGGYPGINMTWESPEGQLFELQIHTPKGFEAKTAETPFYEGRRAYRAAIIAIKSKAETEGRPLTVAEMAKIDDYDHTVLAIEEETRKLFAPIQPPDGAISFPDFPVKHPSR